MAGTVVADSIQAASTSTLVLKNGVANTPPTIQDSAGTQIGTFCRAWANFNGTTNTGGFCTIRGSFNVTSVADNGTGLYTLNIDNAFSDSNYAVVVSSTQQAAGSGNQVIGIASDTGSYSTTAVSFRCQNSAGADTDQAYVTVAIFR